ncbi:hypothetical protein F5144DRAFT_479175 [Chaetomium tenue]|uniref:Uncharacterized protein n=1 Tax=Chaetomium tenue TaxID=1854479 RepID=A0ACB7PLT9_9PEZI|nr:hypothetical protein F5144DRAFT_479175 [Chaetomium globosum]
MSSSDRQGTGTGNPTTPRVPGNKTVTKTATTTGQRTTATQGTGSVQKTASTTTTAGQKPTPKPAVTKPAAAKPKLVPASAWDVKGLRVLVPDNKGGFDNVPAGTDVFDCTASIISMALDLLETRSSIIALRMHTTRVIDASQHLPKVRNIQDDDIEPTIRRYLAAIRASFPHVVVSDKYGMATMNGRTNKKEWKEGADPKTATVIELNAMLVGRVAAAHKALQTGNSASNMRRFRNLHMRLSITMAHELVHVYNLFLQGGQHNHTPPSVSYGPYGDDKVGESGRYWEYWTLGGWVDMRADGNGMETIALRDSHGQKAWVVKPDVVDGLLGREFGKWLQPSTPLNDEEHPKGTFVDKITPLNWKDRYTDVFPRPAPVAKGAAAPQAEFTAKQVAVLTGADMMKTAKYNVCGNDLQAFGLNPRTKLRLAA